LFSFFSPPLPFIFSHFLYLPLLFFLIFPTHGSRTKKHESLRARPRARVLRARPRPPPSTSRRRDRAPATRIDLPPPRSSAAAAAGGSELRFEATITPRLPFMLEVRRFASEHLTRLELPPATSSSRARPSLVPLPAVELLRPHPWRRRPTWVRPGRPERRSMTPSSRTPS
jgi:hypothetical protein